MTEPLICFGFEVSEPWELPDNLKHCGVAVDQWFNWILKDFYGDNVERYGGGLEGAWATVMKFMNYVKEPRGEDRWQSPQLLLTTPSGTLYCGDCEDHALFFAAVVHQFTDYKPEDIFITVFHDRIGNVVHAVCVVRTEKGNVVLDQRARFGTYEDFGPGVEGIAPIFSIALTGEVFLHGRKV